MGKTLRKYIQLDDDILEILYTYNENLDKYFGDYPDFKENPRYTPNGKPWVNVMDSDCPYHTGEYGDCGLCPYLKKANPKDIIGICTHESKCNKKGEI